MCYFIEHIIADIKRSNMLIVYKLKQHTQMRADFRSCCCFYNAVFHCASAATKCLFHTFLLREFNRVKNIDNYRTKSQILAKKRMNKSYKLRC